MNPQKNYLSESDFAFRKVLEGTYLVIKLPEGVTYLSMGLHIDLERLIGMLNSSHKIAIFDDNFKCLHANFSLGVDEQ